jgi:hypothetical protein
MSKRSSSPGSSGCCCRPEHPQLPRVGLFCPSPSGEAARALVWLAGVAQISEAVHDLPRVPRPKVQRCESVEPDLHTFRHHERATGTSADICHLISIDHPWSAQPSQPEAWLQDKVILRGVQVDEGKSKPLEVARLKTAEGSGYGTSSGVVGTPTCTADRSGMGSRLCLR